MSIYADNDRALKYYRGELYTTVKATQFSQDECNMRITHHTAVDGMKYMTIEYSDSKVRMNSSYSPEHEAKMWADKCFEKAAISRVITVYGFGNGYCIRNICKRMGKRDKLIIYEPSVKIFLNMVEHYDITDIVSDERVYMYVGRDAYIYMKETYLYHVGVIHYPWSYEIYHPQYEKIMPEMFDFFFDTLMNYKESQSSALATMAALGRLNVDNLLYSMSMTGVEKSDIIESYIGKFPMNATAVVVAAGPSLKKNIHLLKGIKGKALVLATDAVVNRLLEEDIIPDVVVGCDSKYKWKGNNTICNEITYICSFFVDKDMVRTHEGKRIYYSNLDIITNILDNSGVKGIILDAGGSVATTAVVICKELGFKNIILIGQDLAYGEDGKSHVDKREENIDYFKDGYVEGIDGKMLRSRSDWIDFLKFYQDFCFKFPQINLVDATEGGARIKGTKLMTFKDAIEKYCRDEFDYSGTLEDENECLKGEVAQNIKGYFGGMENFFISCRNGIKKAKKMAEGLAEKELDCDGLCVDKSYNEMSAMFEKMIEAPQMQLLLQYMMYELKEHFNGLYRQYDDEREVVKNHLQCLEKIMDIIENGIPKFSSMIDEYFM